MRTAGCVTGWDLVLQEVWETKPQTEMVSGDQSFEGLILVGDKKLLEVLNIRMTSNLWQSWERVCD